MNQLKTWMIAAKPEEILGLAGLSGTSRDYLYQLAAGRRRASSELAGRIAAGADKIRAGSEGRLPRLGREDVSSVCRDCAYARGWLGVQRASARAKAVLAAQEEGAGSGKETKSGPE